jgi:hypothetical protein
MTRRDASGVRSLRRVRLARHTYRRPPTRRSSGCAAHRSAYAASAQRRLLGGRLRVRRASRTMREPASRSIGAKTGRALRAPAGLRLERCAWDPVFRARNGEALRHTARIRTRLPQEGDVQRRTSQTPHLQFVCGARAPPGDRTQTSSSRCTVPLGHHGECDRAKGSARYFASWLRSGPTETRSIGVARSSCTRAT